MSYYNYTYRKKGIQKIKETKKIIKKKTKRLEQKDYEEEEFEQDKQTETRNQNNKKIIVRTRNAILSNFFKTTYGGRA